MVAGGAPTRLSDANVAVSHGDHLEYEAAAGRIVMKGGAPALFDEAKGFTTGQRLTFFIHDDRLLVDGGEKSRALSEYRMPQ